MNRGPGLLLLAVAALAAAPGCALRGARLSILEENDVLNVGDGLDMDRDYTQGSAAALTLTDADTPEWAREVARRIPLFADGARVHLGLVLGQEIYTPKDIADPGLVPDDRPYAGWLHVGAALQGLSLDDDPARRRDRLDHLQLDLGVVGPASLAEPSQNVTHRILGIDEAEGWDHQLANEPALLATWERRWRVLHVDLGGGAGIDALPRVRVRAGTVHVDGTAGALARVGWNLPRDFGPMAVDGTGLTEGTPPPAPWLLLYGGQEARGIAHEVFTDGGVFRDGHSVTGRNLVLESTLGLSAGWGPLSATFGQSWRGPEFRERGRHHRSSTLLVSWTWYF